MNHHRHHHYNLHKINNIMLMNNINKSFDTRNILSFDDINSMIQNQYLYVYHFVTAQERFHSIEI